MPNLITAKEIREIFSYDAETGIFLWRVSRGKAARGAVAGRKSLYGYMEIKFDKKIYKAHRLAWLYIYGKWPKQQIDHVNGVRDDNRIENLRECSAVQNQQNRKINSNNTSGYPGVDFNKRADRWRAYIRLNGSLKHLGFFANPQDAHAAYLKAKSEFHTFNPIPRKEM